MAAMGYAILRMEPRTIQGTAAMLRHALREAPVPNAEPGAEPPQVLAGHGTAQAGMAVLRGMVEDCKAAKRWQKSIKPVVDVLVTFAATMARAWTSASRTATSGMPWTF